MTSKIQLDRDVISRICKHNLAQKLIKGRLDLSDFKLGLVSKKCFLALKTACDEECKAAKDWRFIICSRGFRVQRASYFGKRVEISEPVLWLLNELSSLRELEFDDNNDQRYLQLLRKINGFGLKRIDFGCLLVSDSKFFREFSDSDHRAEMLRIISESSGSGTLKELCYVPDILVPHLPHTLKLEKLTASLRSIPMNSNIKDFLQLSTKKVEIYANDCYLPSHLLTNTNAPTLHVFADESWTEGIEESSVEIQPNPSIQEISIVLRNGSSGIPDKIYDIKKIIESIPKGYPNLNLLEIKDIYFMGVYGMEYVSSYSTLHGQALQFVTKLFMKTEALLSELQDLSFSIKIKQVFQASSIIFYIDSVNEISSLRKDEWKDFEEVQDDPLAGNSEYLSLKKSTQFGEGKSLEVTFFISQR